MHMASQIERSCDRDANVRVLPTMLLFVQIPCLNEEGSLPTS